MLKSAITAALALTALTACQTAPAQEPEQTPAPPAAAEQQADIDMFTLAIEAGRWNAMLDRALEGARAAPADAADEDLSLRIDRSLKAGVLDYIKLHNEICAKGLATGDDCALAILPPWIFDPPTSGIDPQTLQERSEWLGAVIGHVTSVGCKAGSEATGEERFCAVE